MNSTRLLIITSFFPFHGKESWVESEANALSNIGIKTFIAPRSYGRGLVSPTVKSDIINLKYISIKILLIFLLAFPRIISRNYINQIWHQSDGLVDFAKRLSSVPKALALSRLVRDKNITHIHAHSTTNVATIAHLIAQELNIEWSYTLHTSSQLNHRFEKSYRNLSQSARFVRTISERTRVDLLNFLIYPTNIHLCRLGVELSNFPHLPFDNILKLKRNTVNIVMACFLEEFKGVIYAFRAMKILRDFGIIFKMNVYGTGSQQGVLERYIFENGLSDCVIMHGYVKHNELINILNQNRGSIFLQPSINNNGIVEGVPVAIMEAMASNMLVVTTNTGAVSEILVDKFNGFFVSEKNSESISEVILQILDIEPKMKLKILKNAREMVEAYYDSSLNAKSFSILIEKYSKKK